LVEQGKESGTMESYNYDIIKNAFDFSERTARQVMVPRTRMVALNANLENEQLIERIVEEGFSRMPLYRDSLDNIIGVVFVKDILVLLRKQVSVDVKSLIRPVHFVPQNQKITRLLRQFQRDRIHMAVVVDEYGGTEGIITMEDIMEELVGEIQDEYDNEIPIVEKVGEDAYRVLASAPITDVNEHLPHPLTESKDYESLSGMLTYNLGRIPDANERVVLENYEFTVLKRTRNNVTLVQIRDLITEGLDE
jgi:CBS domain containing-hemolysin-like protein